MSNRFPLLSSVQQLFAAKQQVDALDDLRIQRTLAAQSIEYKHVFRLFPLLLHFNHPQLPAYVEHAPDGIWGFEASGYQKNYLRSLSLENLFYAHTSNTAMFDALYLMGSIGSITQTTDSDLDVWLCYSRSFSEEQLRLIEEKQRRVREWASCFGVELNFYLMNPEQFKQRKPLSNVNDEHSGSAQHFFLLDEFYRSAVRLAGKRLLWLHLPESESQSYTETIIQAAESRLINLDEWLDFGDFSELSINEFFGASLWQLYKGIDAPYKSAIKILLLESYAETYPDTCLISKKFKKILLEQGAQHYHFDAYLAMFEQVTDYLTARQEQERLEGLRICFYLKATEGEYRPNWRFDMLQSLVKAWGWRAERIQTLNSRAFWKIKQAMKHQKMLVGILMRSYHNLIHFARKFRIEPNILAHDTDILMRKLYSVFEALPGKVALINPNITTNLAEAEVTFIEVTENGGMKPGWYLMNQGVYSPYDSSRRYVQYQKSLNKLVAWAYFNGLLTVNTKLNLVSKSISLARLRQFIADLRLNFPIHAPPISNEDLHHPNEIRHFVMTINLVSDPTKSVSDETLVLSHRDLFNLNVSGQGLVGSVGIIYRNMWNEIRTQYFEGQNALLNALKLLSNKIYRGSAPPQSVNVFCYSSRLQAELKREITRLVHKCICIQTGTLVQKLPLSSAKQTWQSFFSAQPGQINGHFATESAPLFPTEISRFASEGFLQFFFETQDEQHFNVYILDEKNQLETYYHCVGDKEQKVREINQFYAEQQQSSFNFPQFYQLIHQHDQIQVVPFSHK